MGVHSAPPGLRIDENVPLAPLTTMGVGGSARYFCRPGTEADVTAALDWADARGVHARILGGGSNVVVGDEGIDGLVVRVDLRGVRFDEAGDRVRVTAAAGEPWDAFVGECVERGLAGLECLSGIPGLVGATPVQNVGAYGQEVSGTITRVSALDRRDRRAVTLDPAECGFSYRDSLFKSTHPDRFVVLAVTFALTPGGAPLLRYADLARHFAGRPAPSLREVRSAVVSIRRDKSMVLDPADPNGRSCGSFFMNPTVPPAVADRVAELTGEAAMPRFAQASGLVKLSAGWLIERAGLLKGHRLGSVGLSTRHALSIVCHDGATARDVVRLGRVVQDAVRDRFGVTLVPEPNLWDIGGLA